MSQTHFYFCFGLFTFFLLVVFMVTFHWKAPLLFSSTAELEFTHSESLKNFPSLSPTTFDSIQFTGDELFHEEKSFTSTGELEIA